MNFRLGTALGVFALLLPAAAQAQTTAFTYTGNSQFYTVGSGISQLQVQLWGAGGGDNGGSGAFVAGYLSVTPGQTLTVVVGSGGGGGYGSSNPVYGAGGGAFGISDVLASTGGGYSGIFVAGALTDPNNARVIAGAGGGGSQRTNNATRHGGGGGGVLVGLSAEDPNTGTGGTQTQGGSSAPPYGITGGPLLGANSQGRGAGGGGGWFGGGGGSQSSSGTQLYGGGGGSSLVNFLSNALGFDGVTNTTGGNVLPGGATTPYYVPGIGVGGGGSNYGGNGRVVITAITPSAAPEPGTLPLVGMGLVTGAGIIGTVRRRKAKQAA